MRLTFPLVLASLCVLASAQSPLTTLFASNNGGSVGGGVYFDLNVTNPAGITIFQVDVSTTTGGAVALDILTIPGTRVGNQTNVAAWTGPSSLGNAFTGQTVLNTPSPVLLSTPLTLPAGNWGVAFRAVGFNHRYTNGTGANQNYSNADLALAAGEASNVAFAGGIFTPRVVNCAIHYTPGGGGTVLSTATAYGTGCVSQADACTYELFPSAASFDLANSGLSLVHTGTGYLALPGLNAYVPPSGAAQTLVLTDDSETTVALSTAMRVGRTGTTSALTVCSNGFVSVASGNGTSFTPNTATFLNAPRTGWWCHHDFNPAIVGSGQVKFEEVGGIAYVTWDGVWDFGGTTAANANTMQFQFELATGNMHMVWQTMSGLGNNYLVGFSEGGVSVDPGSMDISAALPATYTAATFAVQPLDLAVNPRPIVNTVINLTTSNITPGTPFGAVTLGLTQLAPPFDLSVFGMPGCFQYHDNLVVLLYVPLGASSVVTAFSVPNMVGLNVQVQSYNYDPAAGLTPLGAVSSKAFNLLCGDY